jgi:hypothetical protein
MRPTFGITLLSLLLTANLAQAATSGYTTASRNLANELHKRLVDKKYAPDEQANAMARVYLRRAYAVDVDPASSLAVEMLVGFGKELKPLDQLQGYAWALDALARGAALKDVRYTIQEVIHQYWGPDRMFYLETFLGAANTYASPGPLVDLAKELGDGGMAGPRRREFMTWVVERVRNGEDPAYLFAMYDSMRKIVFSVGGQTEDLKRFVAAIEIGVPPMALSATVKMMSQQYQSGTQFEEAFNKIMGRYSSGDEFEEAVKAIVPPQKAPEAWEK